MYKHVGDMRQLATDGALNAMCDVMPGSDEESAHTERKQGPS